MMAKEIQPSKILKKFFSSDDIISYYSNLGLLPSEKKLFRMYLNKKGKVMDLFCGAGRVSITLAKRGFNVVGIDNNIKMIKMAKKLKKKYNLDNVNFICMDASRMGSIKEKFDYILIPGGSLQCIVSNNKRKLVIKKSYQALKKNGFFVGSFGSCFYPLRTFLKIFFHNIWYIIKSFTFYRNSNLGLNDIILIVNNKLLFIHFFIPFELKKIFKESGFKSLKIISLNELDTTRNKFKNIKIYHCLKYFLSYYLIARK